MKKTMKKCLAAAMAIALLVPATGTAYAGEWVFDGPESWQWWYKNDDGSCPKDKWEQIDSNWYHFDDTGYLDVGWRSFGDGNIYHLDANGIMLKNVQFEGGHIDDQGKVFMDDVRYVDGKLTYRQVDHQEENGEWDVQGVLIREYKGTDQTRANLADALAAKIAGTAGDGYDQNLSIDFQLPADWNETCPYIFIDQVVDVVCKERWMMVGNDYYSGERSVDANNVLHITVQHKQGETW